MYNLMERPVDVTGSGWMTRADEEVEFFEGLSYHGQLGTYAALLSYERWEQESWEDHQAEVAAGGRTICPKCGRRSVKHRGVYTLGYAGHPGAEQSDLAKCESCDYEDLA